MDVREQRLKNLRTICDERFGGVQSQLAKALGRSASQIGQWFTGVRTISEESAQEIERKLRLPRKFLDTPPGAPDAETSAHGVMEQSAAYASTPDEIALLEKYRRLNARGRTALQRVSDALDEPGQLDNASNGG